jgi:spore germination protein KA
VPQNQDVGLREFRIGIKKEAFIVFFDGMIDRQTINRDILHRLMDKEIYSNFNSENLIDVITKDVLTINSLKKCNTIEAAEIEIRRGYH